MAGRCYRLIELRMVELRRWLTVLGSYARLCTGVWPLLPWFPLSPSSSVIMFLASLLRISLAVNSQLFQIINTLAATSCDHMPKCAPAQDNYS